MSGTVRIGTAVELTTALTAVVSTPARRQLARPALSVFGSAFGEFPFLYHNSTAFAGHGLTFNTPSVMG